MSKFSYVIAENPSKKLFLVFFDFSRLPGTSPWARIAGRLWATLQLPSLGQIAFRNSGPAPRRATAVGRSKSDGAEPTRPEEDDKDGGLSARSRARVRFGDSRNRALAAATVDGFGIASRDDDAGQPPGNRRSDDSVGDAESPEGPEIGRV
jgi:hypothetical protein